VYVKGKEYNIISKRGVYTATVKAVTDKDVNLLERLALIAKVEEIEPLVKFAYH
jgi:hypothetical protein